MKADVVRWGIIGCGDVTERKSGPAFQQARGSQLVAVMRRTPDLAADYARRHGVPRWYDNADALIADPGVDAIYIATPPGSHMDHTLRAAAAGKPVYVEKPMALNHAQCLRMIDACAAGGVPLFVAYYRRALPRFVRVRNLIADGTIGDLRHVAITLLRPAPQWQGAEVPWRLVPEQSGGGLFHDLASHMLDVVDWIAGPIVEAQGQTARHDARMAAADHVAGVWRHADGALGTGRWCFAAGSPATDEIAFIGSRGSIRLASFECRQPVRVETADGIRDETIADPDPIQGPLVQLVVDALLGHGESPSTGTTGARTSWVMDRLLGHASCGPRS